MTGKDGLFDRSGEKKRYEEQNFNVFDEEGGRVFIDVDNEALTWKACGAPVFEETTVKSWQLSGVIL
ncbi:unnamed protein product [Enterobius vermicularis]|uniref:Bulb-type lectin domain-containing protein n=1 Tax=Enterobius vermicularis TaxID=51028 RepID=A0A0N4V3C4_ENTVE|nr:unnamed protein product [Enterobius vermicularis]